MTFPPHICYAPPHPRNLHYRALRRRRYAIRITTDHHHSFRHHFPPPTGDEGLEIEDEDRPATMLFKISGASIEADTQSIRCQFDRRMQLSTT